MKIKYFAFILIVIFMNLALISCKKVIDVLLGPYPVTGIIDVPATAIVGEPLTLSGKVQPDKASFINIIWSYKSGRATFNPFKNQITAYAAGPIEVTATIINGAAREGDSYIGTKNYIQDFTITAQDKAQQSAAFTGLSTADSSSPTTRLILQFDEDISGLSGADISLNSGATGAVKGDLYRTGNGTYELAIFGVTNSGTVTVGVTKVAYTINPASRAVMIKGPPIVNPDLPDPDIAVAFSSLATSDSESPTTKLILNFNKDIPGLSGADISLNAGGTGAIKGELARTGTGIYELGVSEASVNGTVTVGVAKANHIFSPSSRTVRVNGLPDSTVTITDVTFSSLTADTEAPTAKLFFSFDKDIPDFTIAEISLNAGGSGAAKGSLTKTGTGTYTLEVPGINVGGTVTVNVIKPDYNFIPESRTVAVQGSSVPGTTASVSITFAQLADIAQPIAITVPTLYRVSNNGPASANLTLENPGQYDSINWRVDKTDVTGTGLSFTLSADNSAYNIIGTHFVTVMVMKDGAPYSKTISFKVEY